MAPSSRKTFRLIGPTTLNALAVATRTRPGIGSTSVQPPPSYGKTTGLHRNGKTYPDPLPNMALQKSQQKFAHGKNSCTTTANGPTQPLRPPQWPTMLTFSPMEQADSRVTPGSGPARGRWSSIHSATSMWSTLHGSQVSYKVPIALKSMRYGGLANGPFTMTAPSVYGRTMHQPSPAWETSKMLPMHLQTNHMPTFLARHHPGHQARHPYQYPQGSQPSRVRRLTRGPMGMARQ